MKASTTSPLADEPGETDGALVRRSIDGDKEALRELVERHQPFLFNIALKMFGQRVDAEDLTQEALIKAITSLGSFRGEASFRTWLYRIATNHFLNTRRRGMELTNVGFEAYFESIAATDDEPMTEEEQRVAGATVEELRIRCTTGMLMCLDRAQRITFILGGLFGVSHQLGAEILQISPGNFRIRLHRARTDLGSWMHRRCGLVSESNSCRCHKKTKSYVAAGLVDPTRLLFNADYTQRIREVVIRNAGVVMDEVDDLDLRVFRDHPLQISKTRVLDEVLGNATLRGFFGLDGEGASPAPGDDGRALDTPRSVD